MKKNQGYSFTTLLACYLLSLLLLCLAALMVWSYLASSGFMQKQQQLSIDLNNRNTVMVLDTSRQRLSDLLQDVADDLSDLAGPAGSIDEDVMIDALQGSKTATRLDMVRFISGAQAVVLADSPFFDFTGAARHIAERKEIFLDRCHLLSIASGDNSLWLMVTGKRVVSRASGEVLGVLVGGVVLNNDLSLVREIFLRSNAQIVVLLAGNKVICSNIPLSDDFQEDLEAVDNAVTRSTFQEYGTKWEILISRLDYHLAEGKTFTVLLIYKDSLQAEMQQLFLRFGLIVLVATVLLFAFFYKLAVRQAARAIGNLLQYTETASVSPSDTRYIPGPLLEFNRIGSAVEEMVGLLHSGSAELAESKKRLELVIEGADLGTWDWKIPTGQVIYNERWAEILGYGLEEIESDISVWESNVHPDDKDDVKQALNAYLQGQIPVYKTEHRLLHKSGKWVWVLGVGKVFKRDPEGRPVRAVGINLDITDQKEAAQQLMVAKDEAESANHAKSVFLANMSHELRTPLNGILGYTQIFLGDSSFTAQQQAGIATIHQAGEHLLMLINDILDLSKIEADKIELVKTEFALAGFLQVIEDIVRVRSSKKGIEFYCEPEATLPKVIKADEIRLRQVILNLLSNAVKFTDHGHFTLLVHSRPTGDNKKVQLIITVEDSGPGIASDMQEKVFASFQQTGERLKYSEGSGLGLAISRQLIRLMGGELQLFSPVHSRPIGEEGAGSRFSFSIDVPVVSDDLTPENEQWRVTGYAVPEGGSRPKKVMVVDDNSSNRVVLRDTLEPLGFTVDEAWDGNEVLEVCERFGPDAILMDLRMPDVDGFAALELLKKSIKFSRIPVIAITASASDNKKLWQRCLDHGFSGYVNKPYAVSKLLEILAEQLCIGLRYSQEFSEVSEAVEIIPPPRDMLDRFLGYIQSGDVSRVSELAVEVEVADNGRYSLFAGRLEQLMDDFQLIKAEQFVEKFILE